MIPVGPDSSRAFVGSPPETTYVSNGQVTTATLPYGQPSYAPGPIVRTAAPGQIGVETNVPAATYAAPGSGTIVGPSYMQGASGTPSATTTPCSTCSALGLSGLGAIVLLVVLALALWWML